MLTQEPTHEHTHNRTHSVRQNQTFKISWMVGRVLKVYNTYLHFNFTGIKGWVLELKRVFFMIYSGIHRTYIILLEEAKVTETANPSHQTTKTKHNAAQVIVFRRNTEFLKERKKILHLNQYHFLYNSNHEWPYRS